jgi:hypothetical protein
MPRDQSAADLLGEQKKLNPRLPVANAGSGKM